ncbi:hypothetical protein BT69DRAFT_1333483 [Atractiella rhizophila]|nr:hypothetical protein BT69DRAFT_1333483 [Atractiella rhizophila]
MSVEEESTFQLDAYAAEYQNNRFRTPVGPTYEQGGDALPDFFLQKSSFVQGVVEDVIRECHPMQIEDEDVEETEQLKLAHEEYSRARYILDNSDEEFELGDFKGEEELDLTSEVDEEDVLPERGRLQVPVSEESDGWFPYKNKQHALCDLLLNLLRHKIPESLRKLLWKLIPELGPEKSLFKAELPSKERMKAFAEEMREVGVIKNQKKAKK